MSLFLLTFFMFYSGMHLYAFLKARSALSFGIVTSIFLILFMVTMIFAPVLVRLSEKQGLEIFARLMSYIGYTWMGLLFLFTSVSLLFDLYHLLIYLGSLIVKKDLIASTPSSRFSFFIPLILSIIIATYGYFEAKNIRTERITVKTSKIPKEVGSLKIVQISDVHIGLIIREERLKRILEKVDAEHPDLLVSTGDLVDGQINSLAGLSELFKTIMPRYGKFAITGNHEFYAGLDQSLEFTEQSGFVVLRGERLTVAGLINIAGVDDPTGERYGLFKDVGEKELLSGLSSETFTLLLKHRPLLDKNTNSLFDLQLSGHTHKGQIFPFSLITRLYYPADSGYLRLLDNSYLYVSRGAGTWGPPIRFLSPPEVTVIELFHEDEK